MNIRVVILVLLGCLPVGFKVATAQTWARTYAGAGADVLASIQPTPDGGFITAGYTSSAGADNHDFWVQKLNSWGKVRWERTYGGSQADRAEAILYVSDPNGGYYLVAGYTFSFSGAPSQADFLVMKLDLEGIPVWQYTYGGSADERVRALTRTSDGNFVVAGFSKSCCAGQADVWAIKLDPSGTLIWQFAYGGSLDDSAESVAPADQSLAGGPEPGGCILAGYTRSFGANLADAWILNLDPNGAYRWERRVAGPGDEIAYAVRQVPGGFVVAGTSDSNSTSGSLDATLMKLTNSGIVEWHKTYGGSADEVAQSVDPTADGGYLLAGHTRSGSSSQDFWIVNVDPNGVPDPHRRKRFDRSGNERARSVLEIPGGSVVIGISETASSSVILRLNADLEIEGPCLELSSAVATPSDSNTPWVPTTASRAEDPNRPWTTGDPNAILLDPNGAIVESHDCLGPPTEVSPRPPAVVSALQGYPFTINTDPTFPPVPCTDELPQPGCHCCSWEPEIENGSVSFNLLSMDCSSLSANGYSFAYLQQNIPSNSAWCCEPELLPGQVACLLVLGVNPAGCGPLGFASNGSLIPTQPTCP